ncbi:MAG: thioredoxin family protein [Bacteroidaceae bacterium]|nr:thioredoxin family protein [Bacteroidaceae bacterium]
MKRITFSLLSFMVAVAMMAQGMVFEPEGTTLEQASAKAKAENKLIFLDCFTSWCGPCKKMARDVFPQEQVGAYMNPRFVNIKIDMESEYGAPLAKKLQIQAFPTFVIFNADAKEIGRFLGGSAAEEFLKNVEEKSKDNSSSDLQQRWQQGDRDPQFLMQYLASLNASYKADEANAVAEAILEGKEETFAADSALCMIFMRNITNPFAKSFIYTAKNPAALKAKIGEMPVDMKIQNVLANYPRQIIIEHDGTADLDQAKFDQFVALLSEMNLPNADHYRLNTLITLADKQKDYESYIKYIKEYLGNKNLDADDMQLARWVKPFSDPASQLPQKAEMKKILEQRLADIRSGKRQPMTRVGNMTLSRPTDQLLEMLIAAMDGKMPTLGN